jgi:small-conductance mechanosensitive channel
MISSYINHKLVLWLQSAFFFVLIFSIGFLFKKYAVKFIRRLLAKTGFVLQEEVVAVFSNYISFWFFILALYSAFLKAPIHVSVVANKLLYGIFAFSVVIFAATIISRVVQKFIPEKIGVNIIKFGVIFVGLVLILNQVGIKLTPILTALGIGSLAVALALQDTLANFFAGVNILASKQITRGDYIKLDSGHEGTVIGLNWRTTFIREISNTVIMVPNSKISSVIITNYHFHRSEVSVNINCGVAYGSDLEYVEKIAILATQEIINKYDDAVKDYPPRVRFTNFAESSIEFGLFFRVKDVYSLMLIKSEVLKNLYKKFNEEKIQIPFPQRVVTINKQ